MAANNALIKIRENVSLRINILFLVVNYEATCEQIYPIYNQLYQLIDELTLILLITG